MKEGAWSLKVFGKPLLDDEESNDGPKLGTKQSVYCRIYRLR